MADLDLKTATGVADSKATPADADRFNLFESAGWTFKALTWANLKATLKTYFDSLYSAAGAVQEVDFDANTILAATTDDTPVALAIAEQTIVGRKTGGNIDDLSITEVKTMLGLNPEKTLIVSPTGGGYATITLALAAASADYTILVYPGEYIESIVIPANNISIIGLGSSFNTTITQVDTKVIDFGATTGGRINNFAISLTAPTTAICAITGSTGNFQVRMCRSILTCTENLSQSDQPTIGCVTGAGTIKFNLGKAIYTHSGTTTTGIKAPFKAATGGTVKCFNMNEIDVNGSGSSNVITVGIVAGTGIVKIEKCIIDIDDDTSTTTAGIGYIGSATSEDSEFIGNVIHVHAADNNAVGALALLGSFRSAFNHMHVECSGSGTANSFVESGAGEINSHMDDIVAVDGYTGNVNMVSSDSDGDLTVTGAIKGSVEVKTASYSTDQTLSTAECGGYVVYVTGAATITLPAIAAGMSVTVITIGAVAISIDPNGSDLIYLDGTILDDGDKITNLSTAGDIAVLTYYGATGWYASTNSWTDGS